MKRMIAVCCAVLVAFTVIQTQAAAQTGGFGIYGGLAIPGGDWGKTSGEKAGFAMQGYGGGLEVTIGFPIDLPIKIGWITSLSVTYNDFDIKKAFGENLPYKIDYTPWLVGWPMTGGAVALSLTPLTVYGTLQIGGCVAMMPDVTVKYTGGSQEVKADPVAKFPAVSAGLGAGLGPLRLGLRYFSAGDVEFEVKGVTSTGTVKQKMPISALMVTIGLEF